MAQAATAKRPQKRGQPQKRAQKRASNATGRTATSTGMS